MTVGEVTPGYQLWHPNREKPTVIATRLVIIVLMLATAAIAAIVTLGGFSLLDGGSGVRVICLVYAALYLLFAFQVLRWSRGVLPVAASLSMILAIFCAAGANSWFARDKSGFEEAAIPSSVIGLLVIILMILQLVLIVAALYGFTQDWHVEEERQIGSGEEYGAGAAPNDDTPPLPA